jgi:hypothetical protein
VKTLEAPGRWPDDWRDCFTTAQIQRLFELDPGIDSGYSHNPAGTFVCIAVGPTGPKSWGR